AVLGHERAQRRAVEVGDHPGGERQRDRDRVRLARPVVDQDEPRGAAVDRTRRLREERAVAALDQQDLALHGAGRQRSLAAVRIARGAAEILVDRLAVRPDDRARVDHRLVDRRPRGREPRARALDRDGAEANTCEFETAATVIASGVLPGEPAVPSPKSSRSLPAAITGTTPASTVLWTASYIASFAGSVCGPPPEKLMTFIPSVTADSNAATISGVSASWPSGVGTVNTR